MQLNSNIHLFRTEIIFSGEESVIWVAFLDLFNINDTYIASYIIKYIRDTCKECSITACLLLNGTSVLFTPLMPRIVKVEHMIHVKNDL